MTLKRHEFQILETKLRLTCRNAGDRIAWFIYDGRKVLRTKRSHTKGDLPAADMIRQQLKLSEMQMAALISCSFGYDDYVANLRNRGVL